MKQRIIRESDPPFANPVFLVKKIDGSKRLCVDHRALNKILEKDRYPLPLIEDQIDRLGKEFFFRICNGPSVFQSTITKAVQHLEFLLVYIDYILIPFNKIDEGLCYL